MPSLNTYIIADTGLWIYVDLVYCRQFWFYCFVCREMPCDCLPLLSAPCLFVLKSFLLVGDHAIKQRACYFSPRPTLCCVSVYCVNAFQTDSLYASRPISQPIFPIKTVLVPSWLQAKSVSDVIHPFIPTIQPHDTSINLLEAIELWRREVSVSSQAPL